MIITIVNMKKLPYNKLPLYVWSILFTSILLILSLPILAVAITLIITDRNFNTSFYETSYGRRCLTLSTSLLTLSDILKYI